jgi:hypothetical protein
LTYKGGRYKGDEFFVEGWAIMEKDTQLDSQK